jgi:RNA polymerase-binding transcription factor
MSKKSKKKENEFVEQAWEPKLDYDDGVRRFSADDLPFFRELIENKMDEVKKEIEYLEKTTSEYSGSETTYSLHMADQGTDAQEREKAFLFTQRAHKFLQDLVNARNRIDAGTYGYCRDTGIPIEYKRLEYVPHATLSIEAKKLREEAKR